MTVRFFQTPTGQRFYDQTMPAIAKGLMQLADSIAALNRRLETSLDAREDKQTTRLKVLIVDDEPLILSAVKRVLKPHHEVLLSTTQKAALDLLDTHRVDVVIADHDMPGEETGIWLLAEVRERRPDARRVLTSGRDIPDLKQHLDSGLVHRFLAKPASAAELRACLREEDE